MISLLQTYTLLINHNMQVLYLYRCITCMSLNLSNYIINRFQKQIYSCYTLQTGTYQTIVKSCPLISTYITLIFSPLYSNFLTFMITRLHFDTVGLIVVVIVVVYTSYTYGFHTGIHLHGHKSVHHQIVIKKMVSRTCM